MSRGATRTSGNRYKRYTLSDQITVQERRAKVHHLDCQGLPQVEIARQCNVTQAQVSRDLKAINAAGLAVYEASTAETRAERIVRELAQIDAIRREAWAEWQRSKLPKSRKAAKKVGGDKPRDEHTAAEEGRLADARYLERLSWCVSERCKILGLYAPVGIEYNGRTEIDLNVSAGLSDADFIAWIAAGSRLENAGKDPALPKLDDDGRSPG